MPIPKFRPEPTIDDPAFEHGFIERRKRQDPPPGGVEKRQTVISVIQGETRMSDDPNVVMKTILGSCIAVCMWDPVKCVGGMNHFLLPGDCGNSESAMRFGVNAMELLVNELSKAGATRSDLKAKIFGGAKMYTGGKDIGRLNAECAEWFLKAEDIDITGRCIGGLQGRGIRFWPVGGRAQRRFLGDARLTPNVPQVSKSNAVPLTDAEIGNVQLF